MLSVCKGVKVVEILEAIIKIGGTITAVILIWRAVVFFVHLADDIKEIKQNRVEPEDVKEIKSHTFDNYLTCLRLTVMSHDMPLGERIIAADKYLQAGGNGDVKKYIENELHFNDVQQ